VGALPPVRRPWQDHRAGLPSASVGAPQKPPQLVAAFGGRLGVRGRAAKAPSSRAPAGSPPFSRRPPRALAAGHTPPSELPYPLPMAQGRARHCPADPPTCHPQAHTTRPFQPLAPSAPPRPTTRPAQPCRALAARVASSLHGCCAGGLRMRPRARAPRLSDTPAFPPFRALVGLPWPRRCPRPVLACSAMICYVSYTRRIEAQRRLPRAAATLSGSPTDAAAKHIGTGPSYTSFRVASSHGLQAHGSWAQARSLRYATADQRTGPGRSAQSMSRPGAAARRTVPAGSRSSAQSIKPLAPATHRRARRPARWAVRASLRRAGPAGGRRLWSARHGRRGLNFDGAGAGARAERGPLPTAKPAQCNVGMVGPGGSAQSNSQPAWKAGRKM
jgi:hypothetical protein